MTKENNEITLDTQRGIKFITVIIVLWFLIERFAWICTPLIIESTKLSPEEKINTTKIAIAWILIIPFGFMIPTIWGIWLATKNLYLSKTTFIIGWGARLTAIIVLIFRGIIFTLRFINPYNTSGGLPFIARVAFIIFFLFSMSYITIVFFQKQQRLLAGIAIALSFIYAFGEIIFEEAFILKFFNPKILTSIAYGISIWVHVIVVGITTIVLLKKYSKIIQ